MSWLVLCKWVVWLEISVKFVNVSLMENVGGKGGDLYAFYSHCYVMSLQTALAVFSSYRLWALSSRQRAENDDVSY
jgi:hypothetical protein